MGIIGVFEEYKRRLKDNIFIQNIALVAGGNAVAKLVAVISAPVITRLYSTEEYGIFSVLISIITVIGSLSTLRYSVTIPIAQGEKLAYNLLRLCFLITTGITFLLVVGVIIFGDYLTIHFSAEELRPFLWLIPFSIFFKGIYESLNNWAIRVQKFRLITRTKISQGISSAVVKISFGFIGITPLGLFLGFLAQEAMGILSIFLKLLKLNPRLLYSFSIKEIKLAALRFKKFPLIQSWSQLLLGLGAQLPVILIGFFYGVEVAGVFGLAQNMINMPMDLIGQSVAQVYYSEISRLGKSNSRKIYDLSISIVKKMFWIGLIPVIVIAVIGPWLFSFVFGNEWEDAGHYARFFSLIILTRFISSPITNVFNVMEKQSLQLILNIIRVFIVCLIFGISHWLQLSAKNAILVYSSIFPLYSILGLIIAIKLLKSNLKEI
ncbi:Membrane protein involved in the export of O-antigen and teichoic acid [Zhouia amylolytica]|uniref:Membrane protein involved in the export of O-antigen and teichoic acid n=1 Tax=Zhouia amylolytica TaxID=376730 RepID=A0A1I6QRZ5_9FLAO|nr:oligosaccharide flippase family protein [Zhouia amylolytica]SFS55185.1 Membrane protein involved in the export of O-antigen and teichoic acid [Zhouia amylolytica]